MKLSLNEVFQNEYVNVEVKKIFSVIYNYRYSTFIINNVYINTDFRNSSCTTYMEQKCVDGHYNYLYYYCFVSRKEEI